MSIGDERDGVRVEPIRPESYRRNRWKNGRGETVDIAALLQDDAAAGDWNALIWRFGHTRIETPAPFSDLSGNDRILAVLEGGGLVLRVAGGREIAVREPFRPVRFPGEWAIESALEEGPVRVLNLMGRRDAVLLDLVFPQDGAAVALEPGTHLVYAPGEQASVQLGGAALDLPADGAARLEVSLSTELRQLSGIVAVASVRPRTPEPAVAGQA